MKRTICAGILLYKDDSVLLVKHTKEAKLPTGSYGLPAGRVEIGELVEETAIRELYEESGLITFLDSLNFLTIKNNKLKMKKGYENFSFNVFTSSKYWGELKPSKKTIPEWVKLDQLDDLFFVDKDVKYLAKNNYIHS